MTTMETYSRALGAGSCDHTWVSVEDLAEELQIPKSTIYGWKTRGLGPTWTRVGKHLRARRTNVEAWLDGLAETPTEHGDGAGAATPTPLAETHTLTSSDQ